MRLRLLIAAPVLLLLAACSKDEPRTLAHYVPADTPYAFISLEPADPDLNQAWLEAFGGPEMLAAAKDMLARVEGMAKDEEDRKGLEVARALLAELGPFFDPEAQTPMGLAPATEMALYGHGLLPVLRIRLADPVAFEASVARIEQAVGKAMKLAEIGGRTVRRQVLEEAVLYLAVIDDQAVLTIAPVAVDAQIRDELLGLSAPKASLADSPLLGDVVKRHGLVRKAGVGFLDTQRLVETLLAPQRPGDRALLADDDDNDAADDPVCQAEARAIAAQVPRIVVGGTRMDAKAMDSLVVLELAPEWASQWAAVTSPQAGAGRVEDSLMWFGFGLDPIKAGTLLGKIADRFIAEPYQCEKLQDLNRAMAQMKEGLNPMVIGMAANFHGFFLSLDSLELGPEGIPTGGSGVLALSSPAPSAVWSFAQGQVENLRALQLEVDGEPVTLPAELVPYPLPVRALMSERSLAVIVGDGSAERAREVARVEQAGPHPVIRYGESGRFYSEVYAPLIEQGMVEGMMDAADKAAAVDSAEDWDEDAADAEELAEALEGADADGDSASQRLSREDAEAFATHFSTFMKHFGESLAYTEMRLLFTERGIEMQQSMRLR